MLSSGPASSMTVNCATLPTILWCERMTPFGSPEVPLVKSKTASSCPPLLGKSSQRDKRVCGMRMLAIHQNRIFIFNLGSSSSSKTMFCGHGRFGKRSRNCVAVTAVSISASRIAQVIASDEAVKFRPTGTLFASAVARFATTAPFPAGNTMASRFAEKCLRRY